MSARMSHPDLPDQTIVVDDLAVPQHRAAGWDLAAAPDPAAAEPTPDAEQSPAGAQSEAEADPTPAPADPVSEPAPTSVVKGRRAPKEGDPK